MSKSFYQIAQKSYFLCYDATVYKFDPCGTPAGERGKAYPTKRQVSNKVEHRSCILIIIIGYRRLARSIFDGLRSGHRAERQDGTGLLKSRYRRNQRKGDQGERPLHPDAEEARMALIHMEKENVPPAG